jgi:formylglycine-generating enzyme required for sulfatase activity
MDPSGGTLEQRIEAAHHASDAPIADRDTMIDIPAGGLHHKADPSAAIEVMQVEAFSIGRHLVTVSAYRAFIDGGGYDDPSFWTTEGWSWRLDEAIDAPRFWDEEDWAPYLIANHPIVGASVYEAEAYANYRDMRLPSQWEWERAARGDDARDFPWGEAWIDDACAHRDNGPRNTVPIGVFPQGVSPVGAYEMVGSVWQWTSDSGSDGGDARRLRITCGGAWNNKPWSIGCSRRNAYPPGARFSNLGFRLAGDNYSRATTKRLK